MKRKIIRSGVFETNSSSSHSISIADETKEFVLDTIYPDQDGIVTLTGGEFGWEWFKSNDALFKANYVAQSYNGVSDTLREVIMEQTGAEDVFANVEGGYVDHESCGIAPSSKEELRNFIFNKNSWVFGGNDNSSPDPTFYHVPEFKGGRMILPKYKYELVIEGLDKTTKFINEPSSEEIEDGISSLLDKKILSPNNVFVDDSDFHFRITRSNNYFEHTWHIEQDYSTNTIFFILESTIYSIQGMLEETNDEYKSCNDYIKRRELLKEEILKDKTKYRIVNFSINKIDE